ncbi:hypothetical protein EVJ58_g9646 [Rhodofomes roseus]|uniref:Uncharacterized protein n=1 Tax=Rhodofomes roseus TaxID=34475 RepID=A0A4Y9XSH3_9APHY|nr:hypothetical protein EVJ58_g9646 [Rhodofomes roseus]
MVDLTRSNSVSPRFRSTLWFPQHYEALPPRPESRDSAWKLYRAHRVVRVAASLGNGDYAVTPNADFIPPFPPGPSDREDVFSDGRRGKFEPGYHPQAWNTSRGHWPFMFEVPDGDEGADPAYVTLEFTKKGTGTFHVHNQQTGKGSPTATFAQALQVLYDAEVTRAESFFARDSNPPQSLVLRPAAVREALYQFPVELTDLFSARKKAALIQHHLKELRAYSYRAYLQESLENGKMSFPSAETMGVGCWIREGNEELLKSLSWFGIRVWYVLRSPVPFPSSLRPVRGLDPRLSREGWDEEIHDHKPYVGKRGRKRLAEIEAELRADEDSDFDWDDPEDLPVPSNPPFIPGPSKPLKRAAAALVASFVPSIPSFPDPDEEGWNNSPAVEPAAPSSPSSAFVAGSSTRKQNSAPPGRLSNGHFAPTLREH